MGINTYKVCNVNFVKLNIISIKFYQKKIIMMEIIFVVKIYDILYVYKHKLIPNIVYLSLINSIILISLSSFNF